MFEAITLFSGYLAGSVPFGLVLCYLAGYGDIRKIGSGNIGATNVLRTGNKPLAFLTLVLDSAKGAAVVLVLKYFFGWELAVVGAFGAVLGHLFPVWLLFKGGKGVATTFGTLLALSPLVGGVTSLIWLGVAALFRYSSLAALVSLVSSPFLAYFLTADDLFAAYCSFIAVLIYVKHRDNIKRLFSGTESKIGEKKGTEKEAYGKTDVQKDTKTASEKQDQAKRN